MQPMSGGTFEGTGAIISNVAGERQIVLGREGIECFTTASKERLQGPNTGDTVKLQIDTSSSKIIAFERSR